MSAAAKAILQKIVTYMFGVYMGVQYGQAARDFYNSLGGLADQIQDIASDPNYSCEDTDALAATIAKQLADVALVSASNLTDICSKLKVKKLDKKNDDKCKPPETDKEKKDCFSKIRGFTDLKLSSKQIAAFQKIIGGKYSLCTKK